MGYEPRPTDLKLLPDTKHIGYESGLKLSPYDIAQLICQVNKEEKIHSMLRVDALLSS